MSTGVVVLIAALSLVALAWAPQLWMRYRAAQTRGQQAPISGNALLFFHSPTCAPCKAMRPSVEELAAERADVRLVDVTREPQVARAFQVMATPTTIVVRDGVVAEVRIGMVTPPELRKLAH